MTRRLASWLLLLLMASSGAYAVAEPRVSQPVRIEFAYVSADRAELPAERATAPPYSSERKSFFSLDTARVRQGVERALYQRPPPSAL